MLKGVLFLRKIFKPFLCAFFILFCLLVMAGSVYAADGDIPVDLTFDGVSGPVRAGVGILRNGSLWVPADSLRGMGVVLSPGPNGKGFYMSVTNPAEVFSMPELSKLAGQSLTLYFPSIIENKVSYFNVSGMELLTKLSFEMTGNSAVFRSKNIGFAAYTAAKQPNPAAYGKVSLAWAHIMRDNPDLEAEPRIDGLGVLSPTWFNLMDGSGNLANRASVPYVEAAHKRGCQVWGLVSNGFSGAITTQFFRNARGMDLFAARMLVYAKLYNLDGINVDFENVSEADKDAFVRFMSFCMPYFSARGLKTSVDVHVPGNSRSSRSHDRARLAGTVDYVMLMAYDEHWRTCQTAGSVASMPWVERAVQNTLAEGVPANKLVLGVPLYMRRWEETKSNGKVKVKSFTLTMDEADSAAAKRGAVPQWDGTVGQDYYSYIENGKTYKVWMENEKSIERKLSLVSKYKLAGAAGWRKGHERSSIWNIFRQYLR